MNKKLPDKVLVTSDEIRRRVEELAGEIACRYKGEDIVILALLRGSFVFLADLIRSLFFHGIRPRIDFISVSSYGSGVESSGRLEIEQRYLKGLQGKNVVVLDDILDTGLTISGIVALVMNEKPLDISVCVLLDKPSRRKHPVQADFKGFTIDDLFVVGYGLDYDDDYRYLPYIAELSI